MRRSSVADPQREFVAFQLGGVELALDVFAVREVLRRQTVMPLPRAPAFVEGVVDIRGTLVPVVDLRRRFGVAEPAQGAETRLVVADVGSDRLALVVDRVTEVLRVGESTLSPLPDYLEGAVSDAVDLVIRLPQRLVPVLDIETLLSSEERIALADLESLIAELAESQAADAAGEPTLPGEPAADGATAEEPVAIESNETRRPNADERARENAREDRQ
jgi:purine-binding chemotaxis protein CheW